MHALVSTRTCDRRRAGFDPYRCRSATNEPPPSTSILIPSNSATLSGSTYLDATDGCVAGTPRQFPAVRYVLVSEAFNSAGSVFSSGVNVTVSNPPTTSVLIPSKGVMPSGSTYLDASASNATSVEFRLFGGIYGVSGPVL